MLGAGEASRRIRGLAGCLLKAPGKAAMEAALHARVPSKE
jgi:hypothetical protein